ncbi:Sel1 repeat domain-containing protein [Theileria equi strain WA]|uniref:Sel1 repeat domain-containing protein n=1 Tax=Theileria equi strain WA TaxID=1537102 RepID=L0B143_THEEQ|nr:Sel1 repeat domain-containing protein [Theileria equi strain WA]AFZ81540.1 Sel1 repeat domain-containing protein [Theileria equi strain WA]|eukprot:XP_004831206.1 Sel1 repeat domain-containing protein [Theileria equi strain WA]
MALIKGQICQVFFFLCISICFEDNSRALAEDIGSSRLERLNNALFVRYGDSNKKGDPSAAIALFEKLIEEENDEITTHSLFELGKIYFFGFDGYFWKNYDIKKALEYLETSSNRNHPGALFMMSFLYSVGIKDGPPINNDKAMKCLIRSSKMDFVPSMLALAFRFLYGIDVEVDLNAAIKLYKRIFHLNSKKGNTPLFITPLEELKITEESLSYFRNNEKSGNTNDVKYRKDAMHYWENRANDGDPLANYELAKLHESDNGDNKKVAELYKKAGDRNMAPALRDLALCYLQRKGLPKNSEKAIELLKKAVSLGDYESANYLGHIYYNGDFYVDEGKPIYADKKLALKYFVIAASHEIPEAMYFLAEIIVDNSRSYKGSKYDSELSCAYHLYKSSADHGFLHAYWREAIMIENGIGTSKNLLLSALNYKIVAESHYARSNIVDSIEKYLNKDVHSCILINAIASYAGIQVAQWNVGALCLKSKCSIFKDRMISKSYLSNALLQGDTSVLYDLGTLSISEGKIRTAKDLFRRGFNSGDMKCLQPLVRMFSIDKKSINKAINLLEYKKYRNSIAKPDSGFRLSFSRTLENLRTNRDLFSLKGKRFLYNLIY